MRRQSTEMTELERMTEWAEHQKVRAEKAEAKVSELVDRLRECHTELDDLRELLEVAR